MIEIMEVETILDFVALCVVIWFIPNIPACIFGCAGTYWENYKLGCLITIGAVAVASFAFLIFWSIFRILL